MTKIDYSEISRHPSAEESPGFLLWRASTRWKRQIEAVLKGVGLTHPQFVALANIGWLTRDGTTVSQADVARHAELDPNTASQILRGLEKKGLISRALVKDERSKCPVLTKEGAALLKQAVPLVEEGDARFFGAIDLRGTDALKALQALAGF